MKLCKDCKFYDATSDLAQRNPREYARCEYGKKITVSVVTGESFDARDLTFCSTVRESGLERHCGPDARFFEPRPMTFLERVPFDQMQTS
jgi:hypothetical protein